MFIMQKQFWEKGYLIIDVFIVQISMQVCKIFLSSKPGITFWKSFSQLEQNNLDQNIKTASQWSHLQIQIQA